MNKLASVCTTIANHPKYSSHKLSLHVKSMHDALEHYLVAFKSFYGAPLLNKTRLIQDRSPKVTLFLSLLGLCVKNQRMQDAQSLLTHFLPSLFPPHDPGKLFHSIVRRRTRSVPLTKESFTDLHQIEARIGYTFKHKRLLEAAFTDQSYSKHREFHYQQLEFLGWSFLMPLKTL